MATRRPRPARASWPPRSGRPPTAARRCQPTSAGLLDQHRAAAAQRLLGDVTAAVRDAAPGKTVLLHTDPDPRATGSNPGYDLARPAARVASDGVLLACGTRTGRSAW